MWTPPGDSRTARQIRALLTRDGDRCHYCNHQFTTQLPATREHIKPQAQGGSNDPGNLVLACPPCNNGRSDRSYTRFKQEMRQWLTDGGPDPRRAEARKAADLTMTAEDAAAKIRAVMRRVERAGFDVIGSWDSTLIVWRDGHTGFDPNHYAVVTDDLDDFPTEPEPAARAARTTLLAAPPPALYPGEPARRPGGLKALALKGEHQPQPRRGRAGGYRRPAAADCPDCLVLRESGDPFAVCADHPCPPSAGPTTGAPSVNMTF